MTEVEKAAALMDAAVRAAMNKNNEDMFDMAENLYSELMLTKDLHSVLMNNFEQSDPSPEELRFIYKHTQILGEVMLDRFIVLEKQMHDLIDRINN